jgi:hypothetical protein
MSNIDIVSITLQHFIISATVKHKSKCSFQFYYNSNKTIKFNHFVFNYQDDIIDY